MSGSAPPDPTPRSAATGVARRSAAVFQISHPHPHPPVVGRLAPSPTGALHLGNARSFLLAWLSIRQQQGQLWLRIEDIDSPRVKPWAVQSTLEDLRWLGLDWDIGPQLSLSDSPSSSPEPSHHPQQMAQVDEASELQPASGYVDTIQSRRLARYRQVLEQLIAAGRVYPCTCSRSEVAQAASAPHENSWTTLEGPIYPGTCRQRTADALASRHSAAIDPSAVASAHSKFAWRWHFAAGEVAWQDGLHGNQQAHPAEQLGDFVIAQADGTPAYQLAVVVDDHDMQVTEIVRGDDLIFSTYRQLAILQHLSWPAPHYLHVPLMLGPDGRRLAKRHGDTRLSTYRQRGVSAEQIVGYLAWTLGLQSHNTPLAAVELIGKLEWPNLSLQPTVVDSQQLGW